jgi:O-antigen ligase
MVVTSWRTGIAGVVTVVLSCFLAAASGLMIAPLIALASLIAFPVRPDQWQFQRLSRTSLLLFAFLAWVSVSFLWSPHDNPEQIPKTLLGIPLYILFAMKVGGLEGKWRLRTEGAFIFTVIALGLFLFAEAMTDGSATRSFKIANEGIGTLDLNSINIHVNRSLGHAAVPLILTAGPVALLSWRFGAPIIGALMLILAGWAAFSFDTQVNIAAYMLGGCLAIVAWFRPRATILILFASLAASLFILPIALPQLINVFPEGLRETIPLSWSWRLEIWSHVGGLIWDAPIFGHGLDASRPLNHQIDLVGYHVDVLPLHPHNAALHVWLETGVVGVLLLAGTLVMVGHRLAMAEMLTRLQAVAVVWVTVGYVALVFFSYGVWQEWHQGAVALAATAVFFLGARKPVR